MLTPTHHLSQMLYKSGNQQMMVGNPLANLDFQVRMHCSDTAVRELG